MSNVNEELITAYKEDRLLEVAYRLSCGIDENNLDISALLSTLHNRKEIDLVNAYLSLRKDIPNGPDFFISRNLFENALPKLEASVEQVMTCIQHLIREAGQDLSATTVFEPFINFLATDHSRPPQVLKVIRKSPNQWFCFVCPTILAGSRYDLNTYFATAIELTRHELSEIRINAIYTLGSIVYPLNSSLPESALERILCIAKEEQNDKLLAVVIKSASSLIRSNASLADMACVTITIALEKGLDQTLHAATEEFRSHTEELPDQLLNLIISNLSRVKAENSGSIYNIDFGLSKMLKNSYNTQAIECLEAMLLANPDTLSLMTFASTIHEILTSDSKILNKLLTHWFLKAEKVLCSGIAEIIKTVHGNQIHLEIEVQELSDKNPSILIFLARKAIGYLFSKPVSVASIILSLSRCMTDEKSMKNLEMLLLDPILLNYPESVREFLESRIPEEPKQVAALIKSAINKLNDYQENLRQIGTIPELRPSLAQREAHTRNFKREMEKSYKKASSESILNYLTTKSVILYGCSVINYVQQGSSGTNRITFPLQSHSFEMEFPMRYNLDPFGMNETLLVFRAERLVEK